MDYIQNKWGNDGYATWFKIMEKLGRADNHYLDLSDEVQMMFLASYCGVSEVALTEILDFLAKANWLHKRLWNDHKVVCSPEFLESITDAYLRRSNECINIQSIELMYYNNSQGGELMMDKNPQSRVEKSKEEKSRGSNTSTTPSNPDNRQLTIRELHEAIISDNQMMEALTMTMKTGSIKKTEALATEFCNHLVRGGEKTKSEKDGKHHFRNWITKPTAREIINQGKLVE